MERLQSYQQAYEQILRQQAEAMRAQQEAAASGDEEAAAMMQSVFGQ